MKKLREGIIVATACLALCVCALTVCGCAQEQKAQPDTSSTVSTNERTDDGAKADDTEQSAIASIGAGTTTIQVKNETGYDVIGVRIKPVSQDGYTATNSFDGFVFEDGTVVDLSFTPAQGASNYDVLLLTSQDSKIAVRDIDLTNAKDITFRFDEGIGYITYTDASTGKTIDNRARAIDAEEDAALVPEDLKTQRG